MRGSDITVSDRGIVNIPDIPGTECYDVYSTAVISIVYTVPNSIFNNEFINVSVLI